MFKISPCNSKEEAKVIADELKFKLLDDSFIYAMRDAESGSLLGAAQFEILGSEAVIHNLIGICGESDFEALFILGRQTMNFIDLCGTHKILADKLTASESMLKALGFIKDGEDFICNTTGMFDGSHCGGH